MTDTAHRVRRPTSIERRLLTGLALIAGIATALVVALFAVAVRARERVELRRDIETSADEIARLVDPSLWDLDPERAERLGEAFAQDPRVVRLVVRETTSGATSVITHAVAGDTVTRTRIVRHDGAPIGEVRLTFSAAPYAERAWQPSMPWCSATPSRAITSWSGSRWPRARDGSTRRRCRSPTRPGTCSASSASSRT